MTSRCTLAAVAALLLADPVVAQESAEKQERTQDYEQAAMMEAWAEAGTPGEAHTRLAEMAGEWDLEIRMWMDPSGESTIQTGRAVSRMTMDGRFLVEEVESSFMGAPFRGLGTTGYNNVTDEYESTWIDNHTTAIHRYTGTMEGDRMVMHGRYKDPATGAWTETRGELTVVSPTEMRYVAYEGPEGEEARRVMEITYRKRS